jgi:hypothetical protein
MPSQHRNLACSIARFLSRDTPGACALVVAGFHTGRNVVADFLEQFQRSHNEEGPVRELAISEIYEIDVNGERRPWQKSRLKESKEDAKKWCVVAVIIWSTW